MTLIRALVDFNVVSKDRTLPLKILDILAASTLGKRPCIFKPRAPLKATYLSHGAVSLLLHFWMFCATWNTFWHNTEVVNIFSMWYLVTLLKRAASTLASALVYLFIDCLQGGERHLSHIAVFPESTRPQTPDHTLKSDTCH